MGRKTLGALEQSVMMVILALGEGAYGVAIRDELSKRTRRDHSFGAVYTTLDRLAAKDFVISWLGDPSPERGGRAKRYFRLTEAGQRMLEETVLTHQDLGSVLGVGKPVGIEG